MNIFSEIQVSLFEPQRNQRDSWVPGTEPVTKTLEEVLTKDFQPHLTAKIRSEPSKDKRSTLKRQLYAITPSAVMEGGRKLVKSHSGLIQFDIDSIEEDKIQQYIDVIRSIPYLFFLSLSASGKGLWGLIRISDPTKHSQHYNAIKASFKKIGIDIDPAPRAINSLRFLAFDPSAYFNSEARIFDITLEEIPRQKLIRENKNFTASFKGRTSNLLAWFNENCIAEFMDEILINSNFTFHSRCGSKYRYTRPDKNVSEGLSVDYHEERNTLFSFSSSVPGLGHWKQEKEKGWSCSPMTALLIYGCGGFEKRHYAIAFRYIQSKL